MAPADFDLASKTLVNQQVDRSCLNFARLTNPSYFPLMPALTGLQRSTPLALPKS